MLRLSQHFTLDELTVTTAGLDNSADPGERALLVQTALHMETVRRILDDKPIIVHSALRSAAVNTAVGGVSNSAHRLGYAVDFECPQYGDTYNVALALVHNGTLAFDQIINEHSWVHIAFGPGNRKQLLTLVAGSSPNAYEWGIKP